MLTTAQVRRGAGGGTLHPALPVCMHAHMGTCMHVPICACMHQCSHACIQHTIWQIACSPDGLLLTVLQTSMWNGSPVKRK
eukprot:363378-Chlamydomonas_euryale.AAC.6